MITPFVDIFRIDQGLPLPQYQTEGAAAFDLYASEDGVIFPGLSLIIGTGVAMAIPFGYKGTVSGRSGMGFSASIIPFMGTIDSDYRGEVKVKLYNHSVTEYVVKRGDRICQLCIEPAPQAILREVAVLPETKRGSNGFASTGK